MTRIAFLPVIGLAMAASPANQSAPEDRLLVFISDTHFGVGRDEEGKWNAFEDARWAPEFAEFLRYIHILGNGKTELIINGDMFELWQSLSRDCIEGRSRNLGCNEQEALNRLRRVLKFHDAEMKALGAFASAADNRLSIVPGNHDAALLFDGVAKAVIAAIGAPADRVRVETRGYYLSADRQIYAEHGHQIGKDVNRFGKWPMPFGTDGGTAFLLRPWGEQFVQRYFNDFEAKYPVIDNFTDDMAGLKYAMAAEGNRAFSDLGKFLSFYVLQVSMRQSMQVLSIPGQNPVRPKWDVAKIREQGQEFLIESLESNDELRQAAEQLAKGGSLNAALDLTDEEIIGVCDFRQALLNEENQNSAPVTITPCPRKDLGGVAQRLFLPRDTVLAHHLDDTLASLKKAGAVNRPFSLFVYSHTHSATAGFLVRTSEPRSWNPTIINTGAWQRIVTLKQMQQIQAVRNLDKGGALRLVPEDLPACYSFVVVRKSEEGPAAELLSWRKHGQKWEAADQCDSK